MLLSPAAAVSASATAVAKGAAVGVLETGPNPLSPTFGGGCGGGGGGCTGRGGDTVNVCHPPSMAAAATRRCCRRGRGCHGCRSCHRGHSGGGGGGGGGGDNGGDGAIRPPLRTFPVQKCFYRHAFGVPAASFRCHPPPDRLHRVGLHLRRPLRLGRRPRSPPPPPKQRPGLRRPPPLRRQRRPTPTGSAAPCCARKRGASPPKYNSTAVAVGVVRVMVVGKGGRRRGKRRLRPCRRLADGRDPPHAVAQGRHVVRGREGPRTRPP